MNNNEAGFELHPQLAADCEKIADLRLCRALLLNDSRYPWWVLVPRRPDVREIYQLSESDQARLWQEISHCGELLMKHHAGFKLNVAALGNMVPQLHVHLVVRQPTDEAWPAPVWGAGKAVPYPAKKIPAVIETYRNLIPTA